MDVLVGIDVGKTNLRVGVFRPDLTLVERWAVASGDMATALASLREHLVRLQGRYRIEAAGVGVFGPLEVDPAQRAYGAVLESSDPAWSEVNVPRLVHSSLRCPIFFDFDVNAGALAEATMGAGVGVRNFVYLSVGTGVGGVHFRERLIAGYAPQLGHMYLPQEPDDLGFAGSCRFHGGCLQGLASGKAMALRWGRPAEELAADHPAWDLEARYLARACANLVYSFAPERIVLGSSVGSVANLSARVGALLQALLRGFLEPELRTRYAARAPVVPAALAEASSLVGAALLARDQAGLRLEVSIGARPNRPAATGPL